MEQLRFDPALDHAPKRWHGLSNLLVCVIRALAAGVMRIWLRLYHRISIVGKENLPIDRSFILIANHASHLDTLCLLSALPISRLHQAYPLAASDYFSAGSFLGLLTGVVLNAVPFERHLAPWQSLRKCALLLRKPGNILILFPEGTRSGSIQPGEFRPGVALLVAGQDIPVVPCHLEGTHRALPKGSWIPWPRKLQLTIGEPRHYERFPSTRESAEHICQELRKDVMLLGHCKYKS